MENHFMAHADLLAYCVTSKLQPELAIRER